MANKITSTHENISEIIDRNFRSRISLMRAILVIGIAIVSALGLIQLSITYQRLLENSISTLHNHIAIGIRADIFNQCENIFKDPRMIDLKLTNKSEIICDFKKSNFWGSLLNVSLDSPIQLSSDSNDSAWTLRISFAIHHEVLYIVILLSLIFAVIWLSRNAFVSLNSLLQSAIAIPLENIVNQIARGKSISYTGSNKLVAELQVFLNKYNLIQEQNEVYGHEIKKIASERAIYEVSRQVAHDIRAPLSALMIGLRGLTDKSNEHINLIESAAQRIKSIADDLSATKGIGLISPKIDEVCLASAAEDIIQEKVAVTPHINFTFKCDSRPLVPATESELKRILSNIIENSIEAISGKGKIEIEIQKHLNYTVLEISDNGCGIPLDIQHKIGTSGFSYGKENDKRSGSGLGLYYATIKMRDWGGSLKISSAPNQGTRVILSFPLQETKRSLEVV